ncbi:unnamed protein product [Amoebophrya sp. A25]|nr:unnamed protein product [Amoebophrya sp. A25]|eukprot:GSA25T00024327001.1
MRPVWKYEDWASGAPREKVIAGDVLEPPKAGSKSSTSGSSFEDPDVKQEAKGKARRTREGKLDRRGTSVRVFIGKLLGICQQVPGVMELRLVMDNDKNRHRGKAFCEYEDMLHAADAITLLNGYEVVCQKGNHHIKRKLIVDWANQELQSGLNPEAVLGDTFAPTWCGQTASIEKQDEGNKGKGKGGKGVKKGSGRKGGKTSRSTDNKNDSYNNTEGSKNKENAARNTSTTSEGIMNVEDLAAGQNYYSTENMIGGSGIENGGAPEDANFYAAFDEPAGGNTKEDEQWNVAMTVASLNTPEDQARLAYLQRAAAGGTKAKGTPSPTPGSTSTGATAATEMPLKKQAPTKQVDQTVFNVPPAASVPPVMLPQHYNPFAADAELDGETEDDEEENWGINDDDEAALSDPAEAEKASGKPKKRTLAEVNMEFNDKRNPANNIENKKNNKGRGKNKNGKDGVRRATTEGGGHVYMGGGSRTGSADHDAKWYIKEAQLEVEKAKQETKRQRIEQEASMGSSAPARMPPVPPPIPAAATALAQSLASAALQGSVPQNASPTTFDDDSLYDNFSLKEAKDALRFIKELNLIEQYYAWRRLRNGTEGGP